MKTANQALDRTLPVLPLSPGRAERHGFEYVRNGTLSLYAALEVHTGRVEGMTAERHTSEAFLSFPNRVLATQTKEREIHIICDNLSAHKDGVDKVITHTTTQPNQADLPAEPGCHPHKSGDRVASSTVNDTGSPPPRG
jgi:hypothetical protein